MKNFDKEIERIFNALRKDGGSGLPSEMANMALKYGDGDIHIICVNDEKKQCVKMNITGNGGAMIMGAYSLVDKIRNQTYLSFDQILEILKCVEEKRIESE